MWRTYFNIVRPLQLYLKKGGLIVRRQHVLTAQSEEISHLKSLVQEIISLNNPTAISVKTNELCNAYLALEAENRYNFLQHLANEYRVISKHVESAAQNFILAQSQGEYSRAKSEEKLRALLTPRYQQLFGQIGKLEGGVKFLVDMRTDLMNLTSEIDKQDESMPVLRSLNGHLLDLLSMWFSVGFLHLERITWHSSCDMLEKISEYEAVHPVRNWTDLKRRVGPYRRCFVFTHTVLPREPLVVLHSALNSDIAGSIQHIVNHQSQEKHFGNYEDPSKIKAAIFYSIYTSQKGLKGIELGTHLIKRVVHELQLEFPQLSQYSTLSPIPGFREWMVAELLKADKGDSSLLFFTPQDLDNLERYLDVGGSIGYNLGKLFANSNWTKDKMLVDMLQQPLMRLCAHYLYREKRRGYALNSVANFHLRNGSVLWRLNWLADTSVRGLVNSCGIMVNYRYYLESAEENSHRYIEQQLVPASEQVLSLLPMRTTMHS